MALILPKFGVNTLDIEIKMHPEAIGRNFFLKIFATNPAGEKKFVINTNRKEVTSTVMKESLGIDHKFYNIAALVFEKEGYYLPTYLTFSFFVYLDNNTPYYEMADQCKIHMIRYVKPLLDMKGWTVASKLQELWFIKGLNTTKNTVDPFVNLIDWTWLINLGGEPKEEAEGFINDTKYDLESSLPKNPKIRKSLTDEIKKYIRDNNLGLPTSGNPKINFGTDSTNIISQTVKGKTEKMPLFEKYYFSSKSFSGFWDLGKNYLRNGVDELAAALANFNFHVYAIGYLTYEKGFFGREYTKVHVTNLKFYFKDGFDFVNDDPKEDQDLGYWYIIKDGEDVIIQALKMNTHRKYYMLTNNSYNRYRNDYKMGYDYYLYSTVYDKPVEITFDL